MDDLFAIEKDVIVVRSDHPDVIRFISSRIFSDGTSELIEAFGQTWRIETVQGSNNLVRGRRQMTFKLKGSYR